MGICDGRVVIVTGAGRGLGRAHALGFAAEGAKVVVNDLGSDGSDGPAAEVVEEIKALGGDAIVHGANVASWDETGDMVKTAIETFGRLDVVVNNAGNLRDGMFMKMSVDDWDAVMAVHLRGHFNVARHAAEYWRNQSKAGEAVDARIINTSSGAGLQGSVGQSNYSTAKGGIATLTLVQAAELSRYGVTANAIAPIARTRMTEAVFADMMDTAGGGFDEMHPGNVTPLVVWLGSPLSKDVSGRVFEASGNWFSVCDGWRDGPKAVSNDEGRWAPAEVGDGVRRIIAEAVPPKKVYGT